MDRLHPATPVTFRDLITVDYPPIEFTPEEFARIPKTTKLNWSPPDGWEKTGYLSPNDFMVGHGNVIFWVYHDFIKTVPGPTDEFDRPTTRPEVSCYLVHVGGQLLMHRLVDAYDNAEYEEIPL